MQLLVSNEQNEVPVGEELYSLIREALGEVLATEPSDFVSRVIGDRETEVSMVLVDDARMAALNQQYRGLAGTTDVLSFPMLEETGADEHADKAGHLVSGDGGGAPLPSEPELLLGDIVISVPRALSQAGEYGNSLQQELVFLAVHGMLHLLGYDDETDPDAALMMERARQVMDKLGLGAGRNV